MRGLPGLLAVVLLATSLPLAGGSVHAAPASGDPIDSFTAISGRAITPDGDSVADVFRAELQTNETAAVTVEVLTWDGTLVSVVLTLPDLPAGPIEVTWDGAAEPGIPAPPNGPYRVRVRAMSVATGIVGVRELTVARVKELAYPINPGAITVFLDPGHGGDAPGGANARLPDATLLRERDVNLDIALKLAAMLRASGVRVSMSRTSDVAANASRADRTGDGKVDGHDDFIARVDGANRARADLYVAIHNNFIPNGTGRTEAFYCGVGCVAPASSRRLADLVLRAHANALAALETDAWHMTLGSPDIDAAVRNPTDDTLRFADATYPPGRHFYYLGQYAPPFRPRALQMPGILMESLAFSDPTELAMLATPAIRTILANAYYDGIVAWLADRTWGLRMDPIAFPTRARVGRTAAVDVLLTNNGTVPLPAGTPLIVGSVKPVAAYDGSPNPGRKIGGIRITAELPPGASVVVRVPVRPTAVGDAIWKVDAVVNGVRTSTQRVPFLQQRVRVTR